MCKMQSNEKIEQSKYTTYFVVITYFLLFIKAIPITKVVIKSGYENKPNTPSKNDFKNCMKLVSNTKKAKEETAIRIIPIVLFLSFFTFSGFWGSFDKL